MFRLIWNLSHLIVYYNHGYMTMVIMVEGIEMIVPAGKFKAKCLKLMDQVNETREEIIISKRGKPVAKLFSVEEEAKKTIFGLLKGTAKDEKDIISPTGEKWNAET